MTQLTKKTSHSFRLNAVSRGTESLFHLVLGLFALACIIPFVFVIIISFSSEESIRRIGYSFIPQEWSLAAYNQVFNLGDALWRSYFNSFLITIAGTAVSVAMCVLYAYPLYRKDYRFRGESAYRCPGGRHFRYENRVQDDISHGPSDLGP